MTKHFRPMEYLWLFYDSHIPWGLPVWRPFAFVKLICVYHEGKKRIENKRGNPKINRVHALTKVNSWATREQDPLNVMDCRVVTRVGRTDRSIECAGYNTIQPDWYCSKVVQTWQLQRYFIRVVSVPPLITWILTNFHAYVSPVGCLTLHGITSNVD